MEPAFVENSMVARFDSPCVHINVTNVRVSSGIANENTSERMLIQLSSALPRSLNTDTGAKHSELTKIGSPTIPLFKRCAHKTMVDTTVMEVCSVGEGS